LAAEREIRASVAIVDLDMTGVWGAPDDVLSLPPETGLVLLGPVSGDVRLVESLGDRPWAYLLKEASGIELARAVEAVASGLIAVQPPLARRLLFAADPTEVFDPGDDAL